MGTNPTLRPSPPTRRRAVQPGPKDRQQVCPHLPQQSKHMLRQRGGDQHEAQRGRRGGAQRRYLVQEGGALACGLRKCMHGGALLRCCFCG